MHWWGWAIVGVVLGGTILVYISLVYWGVVKPVNRYHKEAELEGERKFREVEELIEYWEEKNGSS